MNRVRVPCWGYTMMTLPLAIGHASRRHREPQLRKPAVPGSYFSRRACSRTRLGPNQGIRRHLQHLCHACHSLTVTTSLTALAARHWRSTCHMRRLVSLRRRNLLWRNTSSPRSGHYDVMLRSLPGAEPRRRWPVTARLDRSSPGASRHGDGRSRQHTKRLRSCDVVDRGD